MKKHPRKQAPVTHGHGPSLEERVNNIARKLHLLVAATDERNDLGLDTDDLLAAVNMEARELVHLIEPLRHAPFAIASWEPALSGGTR